MSQYKEDLANVSLYANDIKRLALMMSMDKSLFILVSKEIEDNSVVFCDADSLVIDNVVEEAVPGQVFGMSPRHPLINISQQVLGVHLRV